MEKLNELVEQAKFVADWHGSDWSSALCQDKDGKQAHEIICESRGEAVISTGCNSNEASWLCDYLELCSPANILAIAEAFRALEQRALKAEGQLEDDGDMVLDAQESMREWKMRAEAAEASAKDWRNKAMTQCAKREVAESKLAELEKQEPVAVVARRDPTLLWEWTKQGKNIDRPDGMYLYARPAPAVSLAELENFALYMADESVKAGNYPDGWQCKASNAAQEYAESCRTAILRKIEEAQ